MVVIQFDPRFSEIDQEIWALGEFLKVVGPQVEYLIDQDKIRTRAELEEAGAKWEDPDTQIAFQGLHERAATVFPRFMRGPFIVSVWASFESAFTEVAEYLSKQRALALRLRDIRGENALDAAEKYFKTVLSVPLDTSAPRLAFLRDLLIVRNVVAHANGQLSAVPDHRIKALSAAASRVQGISVTDRYVALTDEYLRLAYSNVAGSVSELVKRVRGRPVSY